MFNEPTRKYRSSDIPTLRGLGAQAAREIIPRDPADSFRWRVHGYPDLLARWNVHPEYEIHLIRKGTGRYVIGDVVGSFSAGHLSMVGSNIPHDWISDLREGEYIPERDVVLQISPSWLDMCIEVLPELEEVRALLRRAKRGLEFGGDTAVAGARELELIGASQGMARLQHLFALLSLLTNAPTSDFVPLITGWNTEFGDPESPSSELIDRAINYIFENINGDVTLTAAAHLAGMSPTSFSRFFKAASGNSFSDMVKRLRLTQACHLLRSTTVPIGVLARDVGYSNLSNFNYQFRATYGVTPREYRAAPPAEGGP